MCSQMDDPSQHTTDWDLQRREDVAALEALDEPEVSEYDPGPEVDDEGGMSEYRHLPAEDPPM